MSGPAKRLAFRQIVTTSQVNSNDTCKKRIYTLITSFPVRFGSVTAPKQKLDLQLKTDPYVRLSSNSSHSHTLVATNIILSSLNTGHASALAPTFPVYVPNPEKLSN
jgi:hypothetical protein